MKINLFGYEVPLGTYKVITDSFMKSYNAVLEVSGTVKNPMCALKYEAEGDLQEDGKAAPLRKIRLEDHMCNGLDKNDKKDKIIIKPSKDSSSFDLDFLNKMSANWVQSAIFSAAIKYKFKKIQTPPNLMAEETRKQIFMKNLARAMNGDLGRAESINIEVFFDSASFDLTANTKNILNQYIKEYSAGAIVIEGYCDVRGSDDYNDVLGTQRARAVKNYIIDGLKKTGKPIPEVTTVSYGESRAISNNSDPNTMKTDRKAVIKVAALGVTSKQYITRLALDKLPANYYLIDASGSMKSVWPVVESFGYPKGSQQYAFNSNQDNIVNIVKGWIQPSGLTPLWRSIYQILQVMPAGKKLTVISDGENNINMDDNPADDVSQIIDLARKKKIKISIVYIDVTADILTMYDFRKNLRTIAILTGGKFYMPN